MEEPAEVMTRSNSSPRIADDVVARYRRTEPAAPHTLADAWVIADTPAGFAQLARRLAEQPDWSPARTFAFANLADPDLVALAGPVLSGLSGATASGEVWHLGRRALIVDHPNATGIQL